MESRTNFLTNFLIVGSDEKITDLVQAMYLEPVFEKNLTSYSFYGKCSTFNVCATFHIIPLVTNEKTPNAIPSINSNEWFYHEVNYEKLKYEFNGIIESINCIIFLDASDEQKDFCKKFQNEKTDFCIDFNGSIGECLLLILRLDDLNNDKCLSLPEKKKKLSLEFNCEDPERSAYKKAMLVKAGNLKEENNSIFRILPYEIISLINQKQYSLAMNSIFKINPFLENLYGIQSKKSSSGNSFFKKIIRIKNNSDESKKPKKENNCIIS